jgi:hypothetical protein
MSLATLAAHASVLADENVCLFNLQNMPSEKY